MAFEVTKVRTSVFGNMRIEIFNYVATAVTTGNIVTGISQIEHVSVNPDTLRASMTEDHTTTAGTVTLAALTAGDKGTVMVFGRT